MNSMRENKTILLVEDEPVIAIVQKKKLEKYGYSLIIANTGEAALEIFAENKNIDLALMDIELGDGIDGTETAKKILEKRNIPIVFFTSHSEPEYVERTEKIASYGYVTKNSEISILDASLQMAFRLFEANNKIRESEEYLNTVIDSTNEAIFIHDADTGKILDVNRSMCEMYGYTREEAKMTTLEELSQGKRPWSEEDTFEWFRKARQEGPQTFEWLAKRKNGELFTVEVSMRFALIRNTACFVVSARDITDRKQTEKALGDTKLLFHLLLESLPQNIYAKDTDGRFIFVNQHYCDAQGMTQDEIIGKSDYDLHPADLAEKYLKDDLRVIKTGVLFEKEEIHQALGKDKIYVQVIKTPLRDAIGKPIGTLGIFWDITERKEIEQALMYQKILLSTIVESASDAIFAKDSEGRYTVINEAGASMIGLRTSEIIGKTDLEILPIELALEFGRIDNDVMKSGQMLLGEETGIINGHMQTFLATKTPWRNETGKIIGVIGVSKNITERKLAEEKLSALFGSMTEMVAIHDLVFNDAEEAVNYRITDCNNAFTKITGIAKEKAIGKLATDVYQTNEPPYLEEFTHVAVTGKAFEYTTYFEPMEKHFSVSVVSPKKNTFATITTDITETKQIQKTLDNKNKELENYLYIASHDLRSPLVNIQGFSQRLKKQTDALNTLVSRSGLAPEILAQTDDLFTEGIPNTLNYIFSSVTKMDGLLNGLLQISRTGRTLMTVVPIDANKLLDTVISTYNFQLTEIDAVVTIAALPRCYGDENLLNQLFSNVIGNAIKYRDNNRRLLIEITAHSDSRRAVYSIKDNGIGIEARHLEKIWNVFYRVDATHAEAGEGLGLNVVKRIAEKHHGMVRVESVWGSGSTFHIELPSTAFSE